MRPIAEILCVVLLGVATIACGGSASPTADVLYLRSLTELKFTNDSAINLHNCRVTIEGNFEALLAELPVKGRGSIARAAFDDLPREEFYRRSRTTSMQCLDDENGPVRVRLK